MSTVYITQETRHDFYMAEEFGDLAFLTKGTDDFVNHRDSPHNAELIATIRQKLANFSPNEDYVVLVGSPYVQAMVMWVLGSKGFKRVNLLRWDNRDFAYILLPLSL